MYKRWSAWIDLDEMERLIVAVVWRPISTGQNTTSMICGMCRTEVSKKCRHEVSCERESEKEIMESSESGNEYSSGIMDSDGIFGEGRSMNPE